MNLAHRLQDKMASTKSERCRWPPCRPRPADPGTNCGYTKASEPFSHSENAHVPITHFVEKPDQATAEHFLATGHLTCDSGMFLFGTSAMLAELPKSH